MRVMSALGLSVLRRSKKKKEEEENRISLFALLPNPVPDVSAGLRRT